MYRVTRKEHTRTEDGETVTYEVGDTFEPTDAEIDSFGDKLAKVESDDTSESDSSESTDTEEETEESTEESEEAETESEYSRDYPDLSELTVNEELVEYLESNEFSDEEIEELHQVESEGEDRITAHQTIDEHA